MSIDKHPTDSSSEFAPTITWSDNPWQAGLWVCQELRAAGFEAYFVGGCVRDLILQRHVLDIDCTTNARPDQVAKIFPKVISVGAAFGIQIVQTPFACDIEVATFRGETVYNDHRHPESIVFLDSLAEDLQRRDFTINAMAWDPISQVLHDPYHGQSDLRAGLLRVVGSVDRLTEDRLRLLRALRFMARFDLKPTSETATALMNGVCDGVSRERIWGEWTKSIEQDSQQRWWGLVQTFHFEITFLPLIDDESKTLLSASDVICPYPPHRSDPLLVQAATLQTYQKNYSVETLKKWLQQEPIAKKLAQRLLLLFQIRSVADWQALTEQSAFQQQKLLRQDPGLAALLPQWWAAHGATGHPTATALEGLAKLEPLLQAKDLRQAGLQPGPKFGEILQRAFDRQVAEGWTAHQQALDFLKSVH